MGLILICFDRQFITIHGIDLIDNVCARTVNCRVAEIVRTQTTRGVICDLTRTSHLHYFAAQALRELGAALRERTIPFVICGASLYILQILSFSNVPEGVPIAESWSEAVRLLRQSPSAA